MLVVWRGGVSRCRGGARVCWEGAGGGRGCVVRVGVDEGLRATGRDAGVVSVWWGGRGGLDGDEGGKLAT